jgi:hypothetical protein
MLKCILSTGTKLYNKSNLFGSLSNNIYTYLALNYS